MYTTGLVAGRVSLVLKEYTKGNHGLAGVLTLVTENVGQHLTKCMDYHQIKTVKITIDFSISSNCRDTVQMVQLSTIHSFDHLCAP